MRSARDLDPAETREWMARSFDVDAIAGRLTWKISPKGHPRMLGKEAGALRDGGAGKQGYWYIKRNTLAIKRAWLIFLWTEGKWPIEFIDHIDGNSTNDSRANLREATATENSWNHHKRARRADLPMGVRRATSGRYVARISHFKRQICIGTFDTAEAARAAYLAKRKELYREFA